LVRPLECSSGRQGDNGPDETALGNFSNVKGVGSGVFECRIDFGPGYRVYFGKDGERLVILLGGGTKKRQQQEINAALANWQDYKRRK
jgi:putative addiction module killer protein